MLQSSQGEQVQARMGEESDPMMYRPQLFLDNKTLWDFEIKTNQPIPAKKTFNQKKRICQAKDLTVS